MGQANDIELPDLGDTSSSLFSPEQEYNLGRNWLKVFRSRVKTDTDPLMHDYLEHLIYRLATQSQLKDRRITLVVVDNKALNAFAVPGGVVGINNGLLLYAQTEDQLASVIAHELAHLSQRHFARGQEQQARNAIPNMAALLASIVLLATSGTDAGIAALSATQAASIQNQLRYSRSMEQEADRIGMQTLVKADMNPSAMGDMFDEMQRSMRFQGTRPPEFLLTHPVTEKRIADARNRARKYPAKPESDTLDFHLMQARAQLHTAENPAQALRRFQSAVDNHSDNMTANRYGLAMALIANNQSAEANTIIDALLKEHPHTLAFLILKAEYFNSVKEYGKARELLQKQLELNPGNYPLTVRYAETLLLANAPAEAARVLKRQVVKQPDNPHLWYLLAETHGLAGDILGVHEARAEYFVLTGVFTQAQKQLIYALKLIPDDYPAQARIKERIREIEELKNEWEKN